MAQCGDATMKTKPPSGTLTTDELAAVLAVVYEATGKDPSPTNNKLLQSAHRKLSALARPAKKKQFDPQAARCKCGQALSGHSYDAPHSCLGHGRAGDPDYFEPCDCEGFVPA